MHWRFLREFVRNPKRIGAVAPSSAGLSREIVSDVGLSFASVVVEYGPGTGAFTSEILARIGPEARLVAIESNRQFAAAFRRRFPEVLLVEDSVENAPDILRSCGLGEADCVISGLPWAAFDPQLQDRLLAATLSVLPKGGRFATFAYLQGLLLRSGKRFRAKLNDCFAEVRQSPIVWRNLPPAFVYRCTR